jgi:hypothetical protein
VENRKFLARSIWEICARAPPYLFVGSGVRLQVMEEDLASAQAIIADLQKGAAS